MGHQETFDEAVELYERALDKREAADHDGALAFVEAALASLAAIATPGPLFDDVTVARARIAITRADLATRLMPGDRAIAIAAEAVALAKKVAAREPVVEASALYMLGKAERMSAAHRHGADSFERSLAIWRRHTGDASVETADAAGSLGFAYLRLAEWDRAMDALDIVIENDPDGPELVHLLNRAVAGERLGVLNKAVFDIEEWLAGAFARAPHEQLRGHLCASRIYASCGDAERATHELVRANELARAQLPAGDPGWSLVLEGLAWRNMVGKQQLALASEVLVRRAAALSWTPSIADTANRIAKRWRPGVEEALETPAFAVLSIEACLLVWNGDDLTYKPRGSAHQTRFLVVGAAASIERLAADAAWQYVCVERLFSALHAARFDGKDPNFAAPNRLSARPATAREILEQLPTVKNPSWVTIKAIAINSGGEVVPISEAELASLAIRERDQGRISAETIVRAAPSLDDAAAETVLSRTANFVIAPAPTIPGRPARTKTP